MNEDATFRESLSAGGLKEVEPFLPYLLQDLWALGAGPEVVLSLLETAGAAPGRDDRVVDLGCGKGALLITLADRYGCRGYGVDLMDEFIDEAKMIAHERRLADRVTFEVRDMRQALRDMHDLTWLIYGHDAPVFGHLPETLRTLRRAMTNGGHLILDATCRTPGATGEAEGLPALAEVPALFAACGFAEAGRVIIPKEDVCPMNAAHTAAIARRAGELSAQHPDVAPVFDGYVQNQREESEFLEESCMSPYFLLRAE